MPDTACHKLGGFYVEAPAWFMYAIQNQKKYPNVHQCKTPLSVFDLITETDLSRWEGVGGGGEAIWLNIWKESFLEWKRVLFGGRMAETRDAVDVIFFFF